MNRSISKGMKFFKDNDGKLAIVQIPNVPLVGWLLFTIASHLIHTTAWQHFTSFMGFGFLFTWAWLEITTGASYFRRALGLVILLAMAYSRFN